MKRLMLLTIIMISSLLFSGCANTAVSVFDGVLRAPDGDPITGFFNYSLTTQDISDNKIDQGESFITSHRVTLGPDENYVYTGTTNGNTIHLNLRKMTIIDLSNQNTEISADLWENVTLISDGDLLDSYSLNRNHANNQTFYIYNGSSVDFSTGYMIDPLSNYLTSDRKSASFINQEIKYVMKKNTTYAINLTNMGVGDTEVRIVWKWYEDKQN